MLEKKIKRVKTSVAVLTSGGFDSNVLIAECLKKYDDVYPIYVTSGYFWEKAEIYWLKKYLKALRSPRLKPLRVVKASVEIPKTHWAKTGKNSPNYKSHDQEVFLPNRNDSLLTAILPIARKEKINVIALGTLSGNPFSDATQKFFRDFEKSSSEKLGCQFKILTPFSKLKKKDVLKKGKGLPLYLCFSCLAPIGKKPCGRCNKCAERDKILKDL